MTTILYVATSKLGIGYMEAIWDIPLAGLLLMLREKCHLETEHPGIQLKTMELIDSGEILHG